MTGACSQTFIRLSSLLTFGARDAVIVRALLVAGA